MAPATAAEAFKKSRRERIEPAGTSVIGTVRVGGLGYATDVVALELREALQAFWQVEGLSVPHGALAEGVLERIFSRFCIGK